MKLPIVIQHHPEGFYINTDSFEEAIKKGTGKHITREEFLKHASKERLKNPAPALIPNEWKVPCKLYSGFVYGLQLTDISAEADTVEDLLMLLKAKVMEMSSVFTKAAHHDWPQNHKILEIEL